MEFCYGFSFVFKAVCPAADSGEISHRPERTEAGTDRQESVFWKGWIP